MNWTNVVSVMAGGLIVFFALLRAERASVWIVVGILVAPSLLGIMIWASLTSQWPEAIVGLVLAGGVVAAWWYRSGRKQPRPTSEAIKVWSLPKLPKTRPEEVAALREENERLKATAALLESRLRRLEDGQQGPHADKPA